MIRELFKAYFLVASSLLGTFFSGAQPAMDFDSVRQVINSSKSGRIQLEAITRITSIFSRSHYDSVFYYAQKAEDLKVEEGDTLFQRGVVNYLNGLGYYRRGAFSDAIAPFQSARRILATADRELFYSTSNFLAISFQRTQQPDSSLVIYQRLLDEPDLPFRLKVAANGNLGMSYRQMGDYARAIDHFEECLKLDSTNSFSQLNSMLNIGAIFHDMEMYPKAVETLRQGFSLPIGPSPVWLALHNNIAEAFLKNGENDSASHYARKGVEIAQKIQALNQMQGSLRTLAQSLMNLGKLDSAESVLETAWSYCPKFCNPVDETILHYLSGQLYKAQGQIEPAILSFNEVIEKSNFPSSTGSLLSSYLLLAELLQLKGDEDQAILYTTRYKAMQDSLNNSFRVRYLQDAKIKYETVQKEKALVESKTESSFYQKLSFRIAVLLLVSIAFVFLLVRFVRSQRKQIVLQEDELQALREELNQLSRLPQDEEMEKIIHLKSKASIKLSEILFVKSDGHYVEFYLKDRSTPEVERSSMREVEDLLPANNFVRIHKSFIVNIQYIKIINSRELMLENGQWINLSRVYKPVLKEIIHRNSNPL